MLFKSPFIDAERTFNVAERTFNVGERRFNIAERRFLLGTGTISFKGRNNFP